MNTNQNPLGYENISKLLKNMAIPAIIANITNALYNIVDQIFIGQGVGYLGNAATNIAFPITTICLSIGVMIGIGTAANFNLSLGKKEIKTAEAIVGNSLLMLLASGIFLSLMINLFLEDLMILFGATNEILPYAKKFVSITSLGIPFYLISLGTNPLIRADRSPKYSMVAVMSGAIINIILNPIFIFILKWGIAGSAWATVISQFISAMIALAYYRNFKSIKIKRETFVFQFSILKSIVSLGFASFVFQISTTIIQVVTNKLLNHYGAMSLYGSETTIAVAGIVSKLNILFTALILGIVQGSQPIVSFNYGARNYSRVRGVFSIVLKYATIISILFFTIFQTFSQAVLNVFGKENNLYFEFGNQYLKIFMLLIFINGVQIASTTFFPAIGKARKGAFISLTKQLLVLLPLIIILPKIYGVMGIVYAIPIADLFAFLLASFILYKEFKSMPK